MRAESAMNDTNAMFICNGFIDYTNTQVARPNDEATK